MRSLDSGLRRAGDNPRSLPPVFCSSISSTGQASGCSFDGGAYIPLAAFGKDEEDYGSDCALCQYSIHLSVKSVIYLPPKTATTTTITMIAIRPPLLRLKELESDPEAPPTVFTPLEADAAAGYPDSMCVAWTTEVGAVCVGVVDDIANVVCRRLDLDF